MRLQDLLPIRQMLPGGIFEESIIRLHEHACISQTASAHTAAVQDKHIVEGADLQDAKQRRAGAQRNLKIFQSVRG
jgi:hypothetical protein